MKDQKEKATQNEATEKTKSKCSRCGNERIQSRDNYCVICGNQIKENPVIIDFFLKDNHLREGK